MFTKASLTYPAGLRLNFGRSLYLYSYFVHASRKALVSLYICADLPDPLLLYNVICTNISCAGSVIGKFTECKFVKNRVYEINIFIL